MDRLARLAVLSLFATALTAQATWTRLYPTTAPSRRSGHVMTYHPVRDQVVLFGGFDRVASTLRNDLWGWTGSQWQAITTIGVPPARSNMGIACDPLRGRIVLFGGQNSAGTDLNDTWELVGTQWIQANPAHRPSARISFAMACDENRSRTVVFGGYSQASSSLLGDTWEWDGTDWVQRSPASGPVARTNVQMAFDPAHGVIVLYGGTLSTKGPLNNKVAS